MSKHIALIFLLLFPGTSFATNGNALLQYCGEAIKIHKDETKVALWQAGVCHGIVIGVSSTVEIMNEEAEKERQPKLFYCEPDNVPTKQNVRTLVKYLKDNPEKLHLPAVELVLYAFEEAYPCKVYEH